MTDPDGGSVIIGTALWKVQVFVSGNEDCSGTKNAIVDGLLPSNSFTLPSGNTVALAGVTASLDISSLMCSDMEYICADFTRNDGATFTMTPEVNTNSSMADCRGVIVTDVNFSDNLEVIELSPGAENPVTITSVTVDTWDQGASLTGTDLWQALIFVNVDDSTFPASPSGSTVPLDDMNVVAGNTLLFSSLTASIDMTDNTCLDNAMFICVKFERRSSSTPPFELSGSPDDNSLIHCQSVTCYGVVITSSSLTIHEGSSIAERVIDFSFLIDATFTSDADYGSVAGDGNWALEVFINDASDGTGDSLNTLGIADLRSDANLNLNAGETLTFDDVIVSLDLSNVVCQGTTTYLCVTLKMGDDKDFSLEGSLTECKAVTCVDACDFCVNDGICRTLQNGYECQCLPFYSGLSCELEPGHPYLSTLPKSNRVKVNATIALYCKIENSIDSQWYNEGIPIENSLNKEELPILMTIDAMGYYSCKGSGVGPHNGTIVSSTSAQTIIGVSTFLVTLTFPQLVFDDRLNDHSSRYFSETHSTITTFLSEAALPNNPYVKVRSLQSGSVIAYTSFYVYDLLNSPQEYIDILKMALMELGRNSNGFLDPDPIFVNSADICFVKNYNGYTFPDTLVGHTADSEEKCDETKKLYGESVARRECLGDRLVTAEWDSNVIISDCGGEATAEDLLHRIARVNVTDDNLEEISSDVKDITQMTDEITVGALEAVSVILESITSLESNSTSVTSSMVDIVDNLFKVSDDILMESQMQTQAPTDIILSLENQLSQVELSDNKYRNTTSNVAVLGQMLKVADVNIKGLAFGSTQADDGLGDITTLQGNMVADNIQASISIPASIASTIMLEMGDVDSFRVVVIIYESSKLFQSSQFDSSKRRPNGPVMSFSVPGVPEVNFEDPLTTTFIPDEISNLNDNTECVFWDYEAMNGIGGWSSRGCILVGGAADGSDRQYCDCDHLTNFAVLMDFYPHNPDPVLELITKIGLALSITGLSLTLLTYLPNKKLRSGDPKKVFCNLCFSLLFLYIVFLVGIDQNSRHKFVCTAVGALLHYFLLSSIFWMTVQAVMMYYLFVRVYSSHISYFLLKAAIFAWGAPLIIVLATVFYNTEDYVDESKHCFLALGKMYVSVAIPVAIALLFNVSTFILVLHSLRKHANFSSRQNKKNERIRMLQNGISITLVMGLTWLFGFFAIDEASRAFNLLFCIFNSLQGFLIFVMYCVRKEEVRLYWKNIFHAIIPFNPEVSSSRSPKPNGVELDGTHSANIGTSH